ncbi:MAG: TetR/AcrR family transcriptional regulator [Coriobacteriales bacterium]|nr:TetR/AcrR family transcriptional regulator [Coriobacteriales bacterium]
MARTVKAPEERRDELLDTALGLFLQRGYDRTSVDQITTTVGVAKGTFYHYFDSKEVLLEQLVQRFGEQLLEQVEAHMSTVTGSADQRFREFVRFSSELKLGRAHEALELGRLLYTDENTLLRYRLNEDWIERVHPLIAEIIEQGCHEGAFKVNDVAATTDIILSLWFDFSGRVAGEYFQDPDRRRRVDRLRRSNLALEAAVERVLGVQDGALGLGFDRYVERFLEMEAGR